MFIKSHPSLPSPQLQKLIPRLRIPRSCLPLAYLDPLGARDNLPRSNLFSAHIELLEDNVLDDRWPGQPMVLIAESAIDDGLFAIERVQEGIYAMCRLGKWVTVHAIEQLHIIPVDIAKPQKRQCHKQPRVRHNSWWSAATVDLMSPSRHDPSNDPGFEKTCEVRLCLQKPQQCLNTPAQDTQEIPPSIMQDQAESSVRDTLQEAAQDSEEVLKMVRAQYQDALYTSKVRLPLIQISVSLLTTFEVVLGIFCKGTLVSGSSSFQRQ